MYKIRTIKFIGHPILGDLELDFRGQDGNAVDTVIFAGENGTGKSTILDALYKIASRSVDCTVHVEFERDGVPFLLSYSRRKFGSNTHTISTNQSGQEFFIQSDEFLNKYPFSGIFSDVEINFHAENISSVTSMALDASGSSRRSSTDLPKQTKQLLIDVQALDDSDLSHAMRENPTKTRAELQVEERMPRFTKAFANMFNGLTYDRIENINGHKEIYFKKNGVDIPIDGLSSGEKQVVYRGCFLLRDINATKGAFVFIDEPEISLHPNWQSKIMDYYKGIFTSEDGVQTSQIFAVTHSPFVIHNENRRNDKVIVLARDTSGNIIVKDRPEYFKCNSVEVVHDAFCLKSFSGEHPTVYLEGRTDEMYFNRAVEVFGLAVPFRFKWIGYIDSNGQEVNTGAKNLDAAYQFLVAGKFPVRNFCLKDCDTNRNIEKRNNAIALSIPQYLNVKGIKKGIENALVLDTIDLSPYYSEKTLIGEYGENKTIQTFNKMACCEGVCKMDKCTLQVVFANLKTVIENLMALYNEK